MAAAAASAAGKLGDIKKAAESAKPAAATAAGAAAGDNPEAEAEASANSMSAVSNGAGGFLFGLFGNLVAAGIPTIFSIVFAVIKLIGYVLYWIFFKIVPFLVIYLGIPLFILGVLLAIMFFGGHLLALVAFFVGMYFYIRGAFNVEIRKDTKMENPVVKK